MNEVNRTEATLEKLRDLGTQERRLAYILQLILVDSQLPYEIQTALNIYLAAVTDTNPDNTYRQYFGLDTKE